MGLLEGKVALVTGGARGQGRAHALVSAREGADVIVVDIAEQMATVPYAMARPGDLDETVRQIEALGRRAISVVADVRSSDELDAAMARGVAELGQIDILIANAGIWTQARFWELTDDQWDETIAVNLTGVWKSVKAVTPHMIERQSGSVVITSSIAGLETGKDYAHYVASKHGVIGLMKNVAMELAPYGIRCNAVCPGAINSPMTNNPHALNRLAGHEGGTEADFVKGGSHYSALKGTAFMSPDVIANAALFLNSDLAAKVTGVILPVDGGHMVLDRINMTPVP
jgi:SDR family mycofactocin-dependent oxidoreductase